VGPNSAFLLLIVGVLGIYWELIWPGRVLPGVLGAAAALAGAYFLAHEFLQTAGLLLLGMAVFLLMGEAFTGRYFVFGFLGTVALTAGFALLLPDWRRIAPELAIPVSVAFGTITTVLASLAKRARRNKWSGTNGPN
jgi:membrane-bound serine protease (ClpP class)